MLFGLLRKDLIVVESFRRFNQVVSHNWPHVLVQSHLVGGSHIQPYLGHSGTIEKYDLFGRFWKYILAGVRKF